VIEMLPATNPEWGSATGFIDFEETDRQLGLVDEFRVLSVRLRKAVALRNSSLPAAAEPMSDRYQAVAQSPIC
jgi:hypothetical protein